MSGSSQIGSCSLCPDDCPDGCNVIFNNLDTLECGRNNTFRQMETLFDCANDGRPCLPDVRSSLQSTGCVDFSVPCVVRLGGPGSNCLQLGEPNGRIDYNQTIFAIPGLLDIGLQLEGTTGSTLSAEVYADFTNSEFGFYLSGTLGFNFRGLLRFRLASGMMPGDGPPMSISLSSRNFTLTHDRGPCRTPFDTSKCSPAILMRRFLMVGNMPVALVIKFQIVGFISLNLQNLNVNSEIQFSYNNPQFLELDQVGVVLNNEDGIKLMNIDFDGDSFDMGSFSSEIKNFEGQGRIQAVLKFGPKIYMELNGLDIGFFPMPRVVLEVAGSRSHEDQCGSANMQSNMGLDIGLVAPHSRIPNAASMASLGCETTVDSLGGVGGLYLCSKELAQEDLCGEVAEALRDYLREPIPVSRNLTCYISRWIQDFSQKIFIVKVATKIKKSICTRRNYICFNLSRALLIFGSNRN